MREMEKRIEILAIVSGLVIIINYLFSYPFMLYYRFYIFLAASVLCIILYSSVIEKKASLIQFLFFAGQWIINICMVFYAPDLRVIIMLLLLMARFSSVYHFPHTVFLLVLYVAGYSGAILLHDRVYGTAASQYTPIVAAGLIIVVYMKSTLGDNHLRLKEYAVIQENLLKRNKGAIQYIDKEGRTRILNKEAEAMYKITFEEAYGQTDYDLLYKGKKFDEEGRYNSLITETLETGKEYEGLEKAVTMPSGERRYYHIQTFRVYDDFNNVMGAMGIYRDITLNRRLQEELQASNAALAKLSVTDAVTEIFNYRYFQQRLWEEVEEKKQNIGLLMIDVDHFKIYNDLNGHQAGNRILKEIAQEIKENVRSIDVVVRYGGEEFAVILPGVHLEEAVEIANRLRSAVEYRHFEGEEKMPQRRLTVSIGVAISIAGQLSGEELIHEADLAMYRSKAGGRNRVEVAG